MPLSKEEERKLNDIGRALAREDPEFAERLGVMNRGRQRAAVAVAAILSASVLLLTGGILVSSVPAAGLIIAFYGMLTLVVVVVVYVRDTRTAF